MSLANISSFPVPGTFRQILLGFAVLAGACDAGNSLELDREAGDQFGPECSNFDGWKNFQFAGQFFELEEGETTALAFNERIITSDADFESQIQREQAWAALALGSFVTEGERQNTEELGGGPWSLSSDSRMAFYSITLDDGSIYDVITYFNIADNERGAIFADDTILPLARIVENGDLVGCGHPSEESLIEKTCSPDRAWPHAASFSDFEGMSIASEAVLAGDFSEQNQIAIEQINSFFAYKQLVDAESDLSTTGFERVDGGQVVRHRLLGDGALFHAISAHIDGVNCAIIFNDETNEVVAELVDDMIFACE